MEGNGERPVHELYNEGVELLDTGQNSEALRAFLQIIERDPEHVGALNKAGVAYARMGQVEGAEICFIRAILADYECVPALSNLGNIYLDRGELQRAIALYNKALKYDPDYAVAHNNIAAAYKRTGNINKQVEHYKKGQRIRVRGNDTAAEHNEEWTRDRAASEEQDAESEESPQAAAWDAVGSGRRRWGCLGGILVTMILIASMGLLVL